MKLTFWGAAQVVTGSMHQLVVNDQCYLLDCGEYQGRRKEAEERNRNFPFPCKDVSAVMLSHAHIDHSGNLPLLVKNGFRGAIYTSAATADLCRPMLEDAASLQEHDAAFLNKRNMRRKSLNIPGAATDRTVQPLYTTEDAEATFPLFRPVAMHTPTPVGPGFVYQSFEAGHIFGSTTMRLELESGGKKILLGFSGDLGRPGLPIIRDPEPLPPVDYLILESTYGNRVHEPIQSVAAKLAEIVNRTYRRGGKLIVPAFAVGRTQQLVLLLHELLQANAIPRFPIFVDSPLAVNVTEVFRKHPELYDARSPGVSGRQRRSFRLSIAHLCAGRRAIEGAQRSARPLHGDFRFGNVRRRPSAASLEEQYRRSPQYDSSHRLPGRVHARDAKLKSGGKKCRFSAN